MKKTSTSSKQENQESRTDNLNLSEDEHEKSNKAQQDQRERKSKKAERKRKQLASTCDKLEKVYVNTNFGKGRSALKNRRGKPSREDERLRILAGETAVRKLEDENRHLCAIVKRLQERLDRLNHLHSRMLLDMKSLTFSLRGNK